MERSLVLPLSYLTLPKSLVHSNQSKPQKTETLNTNFCCYSIKKNLWNKTNKKSLLNKIADIVNFNLYKNITVIVISMVIPSKERQSHLPKIPQHRIYWTTFKSTCKSIQKDVFTEFAIHLFYCFKIIKQIKVDFW